MKNIEQRLSIFGVIPHLYYSHVLGQFDLSLFILFLINRKN